MIPSTTRVFLCTDPVDMRRGFDGLAQAAREHLDQDPLSGALFCFINKRKNRLKVLWFDRNGYCILYKRLSRARFCLPDRRTISPSMLASILRGVESSRTRSL